MVKTLTRRLGGMTPACLNFAPMIENIAFVVLLGVTSYV